MSKLIRKPHGKATAKAVPKSANFHRLKEAHELMEDEEWEEAFDMLLGLEEDAPDDTALLDMLGKCAFQLEERETLLRVAMKLNELLPDMPDVHVKLAIAFMECDCPVTTLLCLFEYQRIWANDPESDTSLAVVALIAQLHGTVEDILRDIDLPREEAMLLISEFEASLFQAYTSGPSDCIRAAQSVIERCPRFHRAYSLLADAQCEMSDFDAAFETLTAALAIRPVDDETLCALVRLSFYSNRLDDAFLNAQQLKARIGAEKADYEKIAEAQLLVSDYDAVLEAFGAAANLPDVDFDEVRMLHFAAVAAYRLGDEREAKKLWQRAIDIDPDDTVTRMNLSMLRAKGNDRHGPIPFHDYYWFAPAFAVSLAQMTSEHLGSGIDEIGADLRALMDRHPEIISMLPIILDNCEPETVRMLVGIADTLNDKRFIEPITAFLAGTRGDKMLRQEITAVLADLQADASGKSKEGLTVKVGHREYVIDDKETVVEVSEAALQAYNAGMDRAAKYRYGDAEKYLRYAIQLAPDCALIRDKLVAVMGKQKDEKVLRREVEEWYRLFPDNVFARCALARFYTKEGRIHDAHDLLDPLTERNELRRPEFEALCIASTELAQKEDDYSQAEQWIDALEAIAGTKIAISGLRQAQKRARLAAAD